jgi:hypothetical protein
MSEGLALKPSQLRELLIKAVPARHNVLVKGAPGIGKTDIVVQAAKALDANLLVMHPVVSDPTDFKGMPWVVDHEGRKVAVFLPFHELEALIDAKKLTICFPDDLGQAPPAVQAAFMQLLLSRSINGHVISDFVSFVAATNRKADKAGVSGVLEPVKSRFKTIVELQPDVDDWVEWGLKTGVPTELIAFIRHRPNLLWDFKPTTDLTNTPCPRTVAAVGDWMKLQLSKDLEYTVYSGAAGEGFAAELMGFLKIYRTLVSPDAILMNPEGVKVPTDPAALYATCVGLAAKTTETTIERVVKYSFRLPAEFSVLLIRDALRKAEKKDALLQTRPMLEWMTRNKDIML